MSLLLAWAPASASSSSQRTSASAPGWSSCASHGHLVEARRLLVCELGHRALGRPRRIVDRLGGRARRRGEKEVVGQLGEVPVELGGVDRLERFGHAAVKAHPVSRRELVVEHLADERVREPEVAGSAGDVRERLRSEGLPERVREPLPAPPRPTHCEHVACELAADDGRDGEHPPAVLREQAEALRHHRPDPQRDRIEPALRRQQAHELADEERVAFGPIVDRGDQLLRSAPCAPAASTSRATSSRPSPASGTSWKLSERASSARAAAKASVAAGSLSRRVAITSSCASPRSAATNRSSSNDGASAACRSSRTSTSGCAAAALRRSVVTASKRRKRAPSGSSDGGCGRSGRAPGAPERSARRRLRPRRVARQARPARPPGRACAGTAPKASTPERRRTPSSGRTGRERPLAWRGRRTSSTSHVLPIPGSPRSRNSAPPRLGRSSRAASSSASSRSRPTKIARCLPASAGPLGGRSSARNGGKLSTNRSART